MRRRDFVGFAASAAAAMPWRAFAQQDGRKPIVGLITAFTDSEMQPIADAFRQRMRELGWTDGRNVRLDVLTSNGDYDKLAADAGRLVAARADIIVAMGTPSVTATRKHTLTTPVVFTQVADPVGQHLIASLARPGGNLTGLTNFEFSFGGKNLRPRFQSIAFAHFIADLFENICRVLGANMRFLKMSDFMKKLGQIIFR